MKDVGDPAVLRAFSKGDVALVKQLKESNVNVDLYNMGMVQDACFYQSDDSVKFEFQNLLCVAVKRGHKDLVAYLIDEGVDFKDTKKIGFDFFSVACLSHKTDFIKFVWKAVYNGQPPDSTKGNTICIVAGLCNVSILKLLAEMGCEYDVLNSYMETPLMIAVAYHREENVEFLLERGSDVDKARFDGTTALHLCSQNVPFDPTVSIMRRLLASSKNINATDNAGMTPLHYAARAGSLEIIFLLMEYGADQKAIDKKTATPLHYLSGARFLQWDSEIFEYLVKDVGIEPLDEQRKTLLHYAAGAMGGQEYFEELIGRGANMEAVSDDKGSVLHHTLVAHQWAKAKFLLQKGMYNDHPNKQGRTPFLCSLKSMELPKMLLEKEANIHAVDKEGQSALHLACQDLNQYGDPTAQDVVKLLLERGSNINAVDQYGRTPLHVAYGSGEEEVISILLSHGADKKAVDNDRRNILHYAAKCRNKNIVEHIFDVGLNVADKKGHRPLFYSRYPNTLDFLIEHTDNIMPDEFQDFFPTEYEFDVECLKKVFDRGASVSTTNEEGNTMLHEYVGHRNKNAVKFLLERGANVNAKNKDMVTPLHLAAHHVDLDSFKLLLEHGADLSAEDKDGRTAFYYVPGHSVEDEEVIMYMIETYESLNK